MEIFSQAAQDLFVLTLFKKQKGTFLDVGCYRPILINNTYLLEINGWSGISIDMGEHSSEWLEKRKNKFIKSDAFLIDYTKLAKDEYNSTLIDYLSVDLENLGDRVKILKQIIDSGLEFKIITIEHDSYIGEDFINLEKNTQRQYLTDKGYCLICGDVDSLEGRNKPFEDWWINPNFFKKEDYEKWISNGENIEDMLSKLGISYEWYRRG